jgi:hypothetical protein
LVGWQEESNKKIFTMAKSRPRPVLPGSVLRDNVYEFPANYSSIRGTSLGLQEKNPEGFNMPTPRAAGALSGFGGLGAAAIFDYGQKLEEPGFVQSSGSQRAIDFLQDQLGKKLLITPTDKSVRSTGTEGYFQPYGKGGFNNPTSREVFLDPSTGYDTLFHEVGHARDPQLRTNFAQERKFNPAVIQNIESPSERLNYLYQTQGKPRVDAEIEAQAYSGFQLPRFAGANPDLNINYKETTNDPWFKEYPATYATKSIDKFYEAELPGSRVAPFDEMSPFASRVIQPTNTASKGLQFGLDPSLRARKKQILDETRENVNARLNPYQSNPTAAAPDYWAR